MNRQALFAKLAQGAVDVDLLRALLREPGWRALVEDYRAYLTNEGLWLLATSTSDLYDDR